MMKRKYSMLNIHGYFGLLHFIASSCYTLTKEEMTHTNNIDENLIAEKIYRSKEVM